MRREKFRKSSLTSNTTNLMIDKSSETYTTPAPKDLMGVPDLITSKSPSEET